MLVMRQLTCVSSRSSFALSIMRGQFVAQLLGGIVLVADHGDAVWREYPPRWFLPSTHTKMECGNCKSSSHLLGLIGTPEARRSPRSEP